MVLAREISSKFKSLSRVYREMQSSKLKIIFCLLPLFLYLVFWESLRQKIFAADGAVYSIGEVKNSSGETLSNVKIYVDSNYTHHYAPEVLIFCETCYCDDDKNVNCKFGEHTIKLEKSGYLDWAETENITEGSSFLVEPVMVAPTPSLTFTPTPTSTRTPIPTLSPTLVVPSPSSTPTAVPSPFFTATPTPISYSSINLNEYLPNPESGNEKVEIKNANSFSVSLVNWQIDDEQGGGQSPKVFSAEISAGGLYTIDLGSSSFLNNEGDAVRLLDFNGVQKDRRDYTSSTKNLSWQRDSNGNWCELASSFNSENSNCPASVSSPTPTITPSAGSSPTLTPKPTTTATPGMTVSPTANQTPAEELKTQVLGEEIVNESLKEDKDLFPQGGNNPEKVAGKIKNYLFLIPIVLGLGFIGFSIFAFINKKPKNPQ